MTTDALTPVRGFLAGVGLLLRGFRVWATSPRLMLLGSIPGAITFVVFVGILIGLSFFVDDIAAGLTGFAREWDDGWLIALRVTVSIALVGAAGALLVVSFTAVTLLIGQPFFEAISREVEAALGGVPGEADLPWWASVRRGIVEGTRMLLIMAAVGLGLFVVGLVPVVGPVVAGVLGAFTGGWFLALELAAVPFERRGLGLAARRRAVRTQRAVSLGFGVGVFVMFLIPLGGVLGLPAAVAGGTLLARRALGADVTGGGAVAEPDPA